MKYLRIVHGLSNNIVDLSVGDDFDLVKFWQNVASSGVLWLPGNDGQPVGFVGAMWVQNGFFITVEQKDLLDQQMMRDRVRGSLQ